MQEDCEDYSDSEDGCCLNCEDAETGCLCYDCKCTKCFHYTPPDESGEFDEDGFEKGVCDITVQAKFKAKQKREYWKDKNKVIEYSRIGLPKSQIQLMEVSGNSSHN